MISRTDLWFFYQSGRAAFIIQTSGKTWELFQWHGKSRKWLINPTSVRPQKWSTAPKQLHQLVWEPAHVSCRAPDSPLWPAYSCSLLWNLPRNPPRPQILLFNRLVWAGLDDLIGLMGRISLRGALSGLASLPHSPWKGRELQMFDLTLLNALRGPLV